MQTRSKEKPDKVIKYAEVNSDVDLDSEEEKLNEEFKRLSVKTKKAGKGKKAKPVYTSRLLLDLPFDEFEVVCRHLDHRDLVRLVRVNKQLRRDLVQNPLIWREARERDGFVLPQGMSEFKFGMNVWDDHCMECGTKGNPARLLCLRRNLCKHCRPDLLVKETLITDNIENGEYHDRIRECVLVSRSRWGDPFADYVVIKDLGDISEELFKLDSQDAASRFEIFSTSPPRDSGVSAYVNKRSAWVKEQQKIAKDIVTLRWSIEDKYREATTRVQNERAREELRRLKRIETEKKQEKLVAEYGWTKKESEQRSLWDWLEDFDLNSENARKHIKSYYNALRAETLATDGFDIFPDLREVEELPDVKALSEPEDSLLNDETWTNAKPAILELVNKYREQHRVETIHRILYANSSFGGKVENFPKADYPAETYDESFFSLATSALCTLSEYYEVYDRVHSYPHGYGKLTSKTNRSQVRAIQLLLRSAELDTKTTTLDELEYKSTEGYWTWTNRPYVDEETERYKLEGFLYEVKDFSLTELGKVKLEYHSESS